MLLEINDGIVCILKLMMLRSLYTGDNAVEVYCTQETILLKYTVFCTLETILLKYPV